MEENFKKNKNLIEALLFAWAEPIEIKEIAKYINLTIEETNEIVDELINDYNDRGLRIQIMNSTIQMNTNPLYSSLISNFGVKQRKKNLSNAAMETLSIIAYLQPTTKSVVEQIRGVKSDGSIRTLLERGLIYEAGMLNQPGKPFVYKTTDDFLKNFEIETLDKLPGLVDRDEILELLKITEIDFDDYVETPGENEEYIDENSEVNNETE